MSTVRLFVSYSHRDPEYLGPESLLGFLRGLERDENVEFWTDERIEAGTSWDDEIRTRLRDCAMSPSTCVIPLDASPARRSAALDSNVAAARRRCGRKYSRSASQYTPVTTVARNSSKAKFPSTRPKYQAPA